jgi:31-O-methyltransferase
MHRFIDDCPESVKGCLSNWDDFWSAYCFRQPLPPLILRNGITVCHDMSDPVSILFYEIFLTESYIGEGFYKPRSTDMVIDGGANIGMFSLYLASIAPGIQIHCFEPAAKTRERLEQNIANNGLRTSITVYPFALFGHTGKMALKHASSSGDYSFFDRDDNKHQSEELVDCITLKQAVDLCGVEVVDFLKLDVEGAELEIVESADAITWRRIEKVALEYHDFFRPGCRKGVLDCLRRNGFGEPRITGDGFLGVIQVSRELGI